MSLHVGGVALAPELDCQSACPVLGRSTKPIGSRDSSLEASCQSLWLPVLFLITFLSLVSLGSPGYKPHPTPISLSQELAPWSMHCLVTPHLSHGQHCPCLQDGRGLVTLFSVLGTMSQLLKKHLGDPKGSCVGNSLSAAGEEGN